MKHYFENVPGLGNVAVSRHAQDRIEEEKITPEAFEQALLEGKDTSEGKDIVWRDYAGIRIVILVNPVPFRGAKLVKTVFRPKAPARVK